MRFFEKLRNNIYGLDKLNYFLLILWIIMAFFGNLLKNSTLIFIETMLIIYIFFRMMSFNKAKRYYENQKFLTYYNKYTVKTRQFIARSKDKNHNYYKCPGCKQYLSVPKGAGKICIVCAKCRTQFIKTSK